MSVILLQLMIITIIHTVTRQCLWCCYRDQSHCESSPGSFAECRLSARWPPTLRPSQLTACESADKWLLPFTSTIAICYNYSARKLILILPSHGGLKAESTYRHCRKGAHPRLYIAVAVVINITGRGLSHRSQSCHR